MIIFPQYSYLLPIAAFLGAFVTSVFIYLLAWDKGSSALKIILAGVAINALLGAATSRSWSYTATVFKAILPWLAGGTKRAELASLGIHGSLCAHWSRFIRFDDQTL